MMSGWHTGKRQDREDVDGGGGRFERHEYNVVVSANNTYWEVLGLIDPIDIWNKLESWYKSKSLTSRLYSKKRLLDLQMDGRSGLQSISRQVQQDNDRVGFSRTKD